MKNGRWVAVGIAALAINWIIWFAVAISWSAATGAGFESTSLPLWLNVWGFIGLTPVFVAGLIGVATLVVDIWREGL